MVNFIYHNPTKILFGKGMQHRAGGEMRALGRKALLHYGGGSVKKTGLYDEIVASLKGAGMEFVELGGVRPNPRLSLAHEGIELCRREGVDCILAVGGGSAIDSAKAIAMGVQYGGDVWDFYSGAKCENPILPIGVVLTIAAAGSESSDSSVITKEEGMFKRGSGNDRLRPRFAVMNPELTYTLPFYQTACGIADMFAHIMERYFSPTPHVDLTDRLCEAAMRSILVNAPKVKADERDYDARAEIMQAGMIAHNNSLDMGRETDWASHGIEHELSALYDIAHGAGLSIVFPAWMKYVSPNARERFVQFAVRVFDVDIAFAQTDDIVAEGIARMERFFESLALPVRLSQAGIDASRFHEMAAKCGPRGGLQKLQSADIEEIYKLAL